MSKYEKLRSQLLQQSILPEIKFIEADVCSVEDLYLAHDQKYVDDVLSLTLERKKARAVGLPLSAAMILRARASLQSFMSATEVALDEGISSSLAGGTHHAHADKGEGFCFFNDFAVVCRKLHQKDPNKKILILDLDVHQGNGNSSILNQDKNVTIVSFHGRTNYPYKKVPSHIDIEFERGASDEEYLEKLTKTLTKLNGYDLVLYQAGVDALEHDTFGSLNLSYEGLAKRDRLVFQYAKRQGVPLAMALGGGYTDPVDLSVEAYLNSYRELKKIYFSG